MARPDSAYWIWVTREKNELVTRLYSSIGDKPIASIQGWEYDFAAEPEASREPKFEVLPERSAPSGIRWLEEIGSDEIERHLPQRAPFLILESAQRGVTASGADTVQTVSRFRTAEVAGHFAGVEVLGPMHYSRALAQSGMLLAALVGQSGDAIPEVVNAKKRFGMTRASISIRRLNSSRL